LESLRSGRQISQSSPKKDEIFSLGLLALIIGDYNQSREKIYKRGELQLDIELINKKRMGLRKRYSENLANLIDTLIDLEPERRPAINIVIKTIERLRLSKRSVSPAQKRQYSGEGKQAKRIVYETPFSYKKTNFPSSEEATRKKVSSSSSWNPSRTTKPQYSDPYYLKSPGTFNESSFDSNQSGGIKRLDISKGEGLMENVRKKMGMYSPKKQYTASPKPETVVTAKKESKGIGDTTPLKFFTNSLRTPSVEKTVSKRPSPKTRTKSVLAATSSSQNIPKIASRRRMTGKEYFDKTVKDLEQEFLFDQSGLRRLDIDERVYADGSKYYGALRNEKREGRGIYYYPHGEVYAGDWRNDRFEGKGEKKKKKNTLIKSSKHNKFCD
jgi:hypothetical protein